jgi:hypothetical protein
MKFRWTQTSIEDLTQLTLKGESGPAIAAHMGCILRTVQNMQSELGLRTRWIRVPWAAKERAMLRKLYPNMKTEQIAKQIGRTVGQVYRQAAKLGLAKSKGYLDSPDACRLRRGDNVGAEFRFKKGIVPHNKGLRRPGWAPGRMSETQFKKGERRGLAARNWCAVGTIRPDNEGYLRIKVRESNESDKCYGFGNTHIWPLLQRHAWEQHYGPIPPGHAVIFKNGDRAECGIENLELVSRADLMRRNSIHNLPEQLASVIQLNGALKRVLRRMNEEHDDGPAKPPIRDAGNAEGRREANGY